MPKDRTILRFAVATFAKSDGLRDAIQLLVTDGLARDMLSCLGLQEVLAEAGAVAMLSAPIEKLRFPEDLRSIGCTGLLASCLAERVRSGAPTLKAALGKWLISRHASQLQDAVSAGQMVLWVQIADSKNELRVCQRLLASSSSSVGVHDLVGA